MFIWSFLLYQSKRRLIHTKVHFKFFNLFKSKRLTNLQKQQLQTIFLQCVCLWCNLLRWMFFVPYDNWKTFFFLKVCRYREIFSTAILSFSLKQVFWKKSLFYANSAVLILMLISKKSYPILYLYILEKLSYVADFFYDNVFYTLYFFNCSTLFFIKLFLFLKNSKHIWKDVFT